MCPDTADKSVWKVDMNASRDVRRVRLDCRCMKKCYSASRASQRDTHVKLFMEFLVFFGFGRT
jgi:hypothetical protein